MTNTSSHGFSLVLSKVDIIKHLKKKKKNTRPKLFLAEGFVIYMSSLLIFKYLIMYFDLCIRKFIN